MKSTIKLFSFLLFAAIIAIPSHVFSQDHYEGTMLLNFYSDDSVEQVELYVKENRLRINTFDENRSANLPINSSSVLLRADSRDLLIFVDNDSAIQLRLTEIEGLINMLGGGQAAEELARQSQEASNEVDDKVRFIRTGDKRTFHGFNSELVKIISDDEEEEIHLWFSDDIYINWEKMMGAFGTFATQLGGDLWYEKLGLDSNSFPLQVSVVKNNVETVIMEVEQIQRRNLSSDEIDIPSGTELMSFFQYMLQNAQ